MHRQVHLSESTATQHLPYAVEISCSHWRLLSANKGVLNHSFHSVDLSRARGKVGCFRVKRRIVLLTLLLHYFSVECFVVEIRDDFLDLLFLFLRNHDLILLIAVLFFFIILVLHCI